MNINDFSNEEKSILTLMAKHETTGYSFKGINDDLKIGIQEVERIVNGLVAKGMATIEKNEPLEKSYCIMEYGLSGGRFVELKELEEQKWEDMALRDRVCP